MESLYWCVFADSDERQNVAERNERNNRVCVSASGDRPGGEGGLAGVFGRKAMNRDDPAGREMTAMSLESELPAQTVVDISDTPLCEILPECKANKLADAVKSNLADSMKFLDPIIDKSLSCNGTPGGACFVQGRYFGQQAGTIGLLFTNYQGQTFLREVFPDAQFWSNTAVGFIIPNDISGVPDSKFGIKVITKAGRDSNVLVRDFEATLEIRPLHLSEVTLESCANSDSSYCAASTVVSGSGLNQGYFQPLHEGNPSLVGQHFGDATFGSSYSGGDYYSVTLGNGWEFYDQQTTL